jgi:hypothetical protein
VQPQYSKPSARSGGGADKSKQDDSEIRFGSTTAVSKTFPYLAYGLGIRAAMPLPELMAGERANEISIRYGRVDGLSSKTLEKGWGYSSPTPQEDCLFWQGVGSFLVRGGTDVVVDPSPLVDQKLLRLFVLGPVLAVLLRQRGCLLLHASAVAVADKAVLFVGSSGWGKSTMAAALHVRGHSLVTDDMAVLWVEESHPVVLPSFPQLKLWPEVLLSLGEDPEKLPRWNPNLEKRVRSAAHELSSTPLPIERIYVLDEGEATEILPLSPQEAFVRLVRHTYGSDYGMQTSMGVGSASHFAKCTRLVDKVTVCSLQRRKSLSLLPNLARFIEKDLAQSTQNNALSSA